MNADDFEKQLQRQPLAAPPAAWREEILAKTRAEIRSATPAEAPGGLTSWRALLARIPAAWGAVAALWLVMIGVNCLMSSSGGTVVAGKSGGPAMMTAWSIQRMQARLLASGASDLPELAPPRENPPAPPRPRSERRRDDGLGDFNTTSNQLTSV